MTNKYAIKADGPMVLNRLKLYHRRGRFAWTWLYNLSNIPDTRFTSCEGSKNHLLETAKRNYPGVAIIDKTK